MSEHRAAADTRDLQKPDLQLRGERNSSKSNRRQSMDSPFVFSSETSQSDLETTEQRPKPRHQDPVSPEGITMATISKVSEKYKDFISKSSLIHSGSPALYQLRPKEEKIGRLTRKTIGEKNLNKMNKTILLVGETGTGKSTLINALFNYAMGVKFEDDIWFEIVEDDNKSPCESQTSDVVVYKIFGFEDQTLPFSLTIIDTPGFGDTSNIQHDLSISQKLLDLFCSEDGVHELSAVCLVMKASENRLNDRLMYIFDSVMSLFGNDMEKNIVALITHSDGRKPKNALEALDAAKIKCARDQKNQPVYYLFDNCQHEDRTEDREDLEQADKVSVKGLSQFKDFLEKTEPQKLKKTVDVLNEHVRLKACVQNLQERVEFIELKQTEIRWMKEALKKHEDKMKKNEKFTVEVDEVYKEKETIKGGMWLLVFYEGAVTCNICKENCHYPGCRMAWYPRDCEVMRGGRCTVCTNKCSVSDHVKEKWIYVNKTRKVEKTLQDMKDKYEKNKAESEKKSSLLENLEEEMKKLMANKDQCLEETYHHLIRLDQIALNVDSLSTHVHLDFLIDKMKEKGDTEKVQKLEEMKGRVDERSHRGTEYARNRKDKKSTEKKH